MENNKEIRRPYRYRRGPARRASLERAITIRRVYAGSDLTQGEIARLFGISGTHVNRIINEETCQGDEDAAAGDKATVAPLTAPPSETVDTTRKSYSGGEGGAETGQTKEVRDRLISLCSADSTSPNTGFLGRASRLQRHQRRLGDPATADSRASGACTHEGYERTRFVQVLMRAGTKVLRDEIAMQDALDLINVVGEELGLNNGS